MEDTKVIKVEWLEDETYQVIVIEEDGGVYVAYQGSLADCEAYIRLKEGGYM